MTQLIRDTSQCCEFGFGGQKRHQYLQIATLHPPCHVRLLSLNRFPHFIEGHLVGARFVNQDIEGDISCRRTAYRQIFNGIVEELVPLFRRYVSSASITSVPCKVCFIPTSWSLNE
jgi:hypothetical protein